MCSIIIVISLQVESLPFQWLIVKNKTIIGPKCTEEQKVLFIAPRAGLYQSTLSVSSWPASAESETMAHAEVFAKKVVLIAVAENPVIEVSFLCPCCQFQSTKTAFTYFFMHRTGLI